MTRKIFTHVLENPEKRHIVFDTDVPMPAKIHMKVDEGGTFWLMANREGFLHLARIFSEIGLRDLPNGYHFHKDDNFQHNINSEKFGFGLLNDEQ